MKSSSDAIEDFCGEKLRVFDQDAPSFSSCFEVLTFTLLPFTVLAGTSAFYIGMLRIPDVKIRQPGSFVARQVCTVLALLFTAAGDIVVMFPEKGGHGYVTVSFAMCSLPLLVHFIYLSRLSRVHFYYKRGPAIVTFAWLLTFPHYVIRLEHMIAKVTVSQSDIYVIIRTCCATVVCLSQLVYLVCLIAPNSRYRTVSIVEQRDHPEEREEFLESRSSSYFNVSDRSHDRSRENLCPADIANPLSKLLFCWVQLLMKKGSKRLLTKEDSVYHLPKDIETISLDAKFTKSLDHEFSQHGDEDTQRNVLLHAMHKSFGAIYYATGILKFLADALAFAGPLLLNRLVNFIENTDEPIAHGYMYAAGLFSSALIGSLLSTHFDYQVNKVKLRVRSALITAVYGKTLDAQPSELSVYTTGQITNFMGTDVDRVVNFCASFHEFWSLPFQVVVTLFLLYQQVGIVFLAGVGLAIVMIILNRYLAKKIGQYNASMMKEKDSRVKLMTEILLGIRVVKFNAWESFMSEKLQRIRKKELKSLKGIKYFDAGCVYLWATTPVLISLLTFSIYSVTGHSLTAAKVFTVIALINMLISPLNAFPWVVNGLMEAWISLKRLNQFIQIHNLKLEEYYDFPSSIEPDDLDVVVDIKNGSFSWTANHNPDSDEESGDRGKDQGVEEVTLKIREGQFIGVIGTVGSGKSSLLSAILAEMRRENGSIYVECVNDGFAVVPQEPWIQHASIRENILWGKPYNVLQYESVIEACALSEDLSIFPDGDMTEVGENGVTLSGGQKARIALARAVYQDKSVYLLDDPLAAVDQHVASHLHERCVIGELGDKTRILCTHHTRYLRHADLIIVMENGRIREVGSPDQILDPSLVPTVKLQPNSRLKNNPDSSAASGDSIPQHTPNEASSLMTEEEKAVGTVAFNVYKSYWNAIGCCLSSSILMFLFLMQGSKVASDWWLSYWVTDLKSNNSAALYYETTIESNSNSTNTHLHFQQPLSLSSVAYTTLLTTGAMSGQSASHRSEDTRWYLMIYGCIAAANSIFSLFRAFLFAYGGIEAAKVMHSSLLRSILKAPVSFFDVTPVGRIVNRFSSDTYTIDDSLPFILNIFLAQLVGVLGTIAVTCYGLPWFAIALIPLGAFYYYIQYYYRLSSRELKRLSSISLSPIYAHFTETLSGLTTIRAFRKRGMFRNKNLELVTTNQRCNFSTLAAQEWFSIHLQMIGVAVVTGVAFIAVFMHESHGVSPGLAGLALSYALSVTSRLSGVITSFTETEKQMVAVERESYYTHNIPKERETDDSDATAGPLWPYWGTIEFRNVSLQYRSGLPFALEKISFKIDNGEKIGIVGRTGSGKSSLFMLLFGMVEPCQGRILIDGVDIKRASLNSLRSKLSIIPQDPFLFSGSIRENLVPTVNAETDEDLLWSTLRRCNLDGKVVEMGGIDTTAGEHGKRLSVGQRQLLCLARALLTDTKIVCLDEATASVDGESDHILRQTIREQFRDRTVLTIAHRIETILDCDKVLVMDNGNIAEFDDPGVLIQQTNSLFYKLAHGINKTRS